MVARLPGSRAFTRTPRVLPRRRYARATLAFLVSLGFQAAAAQAPMLVADAGRDALILIDLDTGSQTIVRELEIGALTRLAPGPDGTFYRIEPDLGWIEQLDANGEPVGPRIEGDPLVSPQGVATLPDGSLVVTERPPETLIRLGPGEETTTIATPPIEAPVAVTAGAGGNLFVLETLRNGLYAIDADTGDETLLSVGEFRA